MAWRLKKMGLVYADWRPGWSMKYGITRLGLEVLEGRA